MKQALNYLRLSARLIAGNALIVATFAGTWLLYFRIMKGTSIMLNTAFILSIIAAAPSCMIMHWIWSGKVYRRHNITRSCLVVNLLLAEVWPALIGLLLRQPYNSDDLTYLLIASIFNTLFAVGMPVVVVLSFTLSKQ